MESVPREKDSFGNERKEGAAKSVLSIIKQKAGLPTQEQVAGYHVRNGPPLARDGNFAAELGSAAGLLAHERLYGYMVALQNDKITPVPLSDVRGGRNVLANEYDRKTMMKCDVPPEFLQIVQEMKKITG